MAASKSSNKCQIRVEISQCDVCWIRKCKICSLPFTVCCETHLLKVLACKCPECKEKNSNRCFCHNPF